MAERDEIGGTAVRVMEKNGLANLDIPLQWPVPAPIAARTVSGTLNNKEGLNQFSISLVDALSGRVLQTTHSDGQGQFAFQNTDPGLYFLSLSRGSAAQGGSMNGDIAIEVNESAKEGKLNLDLKWSSCGLYYTDHNERAVAQPAPK